MDLIKDCFEEREIKLLLVDDSAFMRQLMKDLLSEYKNIKIETASNGKMALQKIKELNPDVITLDVEMPILNGLEFLEVMKEQNIFVPTMMLSKLTKKNSIITMKALELGAIDFIQKPDSGFLAIELNKFSQELYEKIKILSKIKKPVKTSSLKELVKMKSNFIIPKVIVIGASTGGPRALYDIFMRLPSVSIPILVVQHMPPGFTSSFAKRLNEISLSEVKQAEDGEKMKPETIYVAPGDFHMGITNNGAIALNQNQQVNRVRPSIDVTLDSVANTYGGRVLSVILTGMGSDGKDGVAKLKKLGGKCIVQDEESCAVFGMPKEIIESNNADSIVSIDKIPEEIVKYLTNWG